MSRADLDEILKQHELWLSSKGESGSRAGLYGLNLSQASLIGANLSDADMRYANLSGADLSGAFLWGARLDSAVFEPKNLPPLEQIAQAQGLELMSYRDNPGPLTQLRKQFQDAGYREQERAITCALNRRQAQPYYNSPTYKSVEGLFKWLAFDLTCEYGFSPGRPLRIAGWLWLMFSVAYAVFIHRSGKSKSGIYVVATRLSESKSSTRTIQILSNTLYTPKLRKKRFGPLRRCWLRRKRLGREWRVLRAAMFFSLMSAFNIGFRDINFGRWLRLLTKREYDLKAVGWARTVSGFQSLLSVISSRSGCSATSAGHSDSAARAS